ncbi:hypothetical protein Leryth_013837, partial [Lithospermum erythrorhizon]
NKIIYFRQHGALRAVIVVWPKFNNRLCKQGNRVLGCMKSPQHQPSIVKECQITLQIEILRINIGR